MQKIWFRMIEYDNLKTRLFNWRKYRFVFVTLEMITIF